MKIAKYISVFTIIKQVYRDFGVDDISESDAIEWAADAVEQLSIKENYTVNTAFLNVENYHCMMPDNLVKVLQIAKNVCRDKLPRSPRNVIYEVVDNKCGCHTTTEKCGCTTKTRTNTRLRFCNSFLVNYGIVFNVGHLNRPRVEWIEVEPSGNNFFNIGVCNGGECSAEIQYKLDNGKILFSFKEGLIALSYVTPKLDEDGYPMIPDDVSAREAVSKYIIMKIMQKRWYMGREGYQDKMMKAEQDWHWYCKQFKMKNAMPDEDEYRKIERQELRMFPVFRRDFDGMISLCDDMCNCSFVDDDLSCGCDDSNNIVFMPMSMFPGIGKDNKLYVDTESNSIYRWDNNETTYILLGDTLERLNELISEIDGGGQ